MNLFHYPRKEYSINHFARPNSWELDGKRLELVMDDGYDAVLAFRDRKVSLAVEGQDRPETFYDYFCFKGDDTTYFLSFELNILENHVYVLDLQQRLVTRLVCAKGRNPKNPQLTTRQFTFGAIRMRGYKLPYKRHCFASDHFGTTVQWQWSPQMMTRHAYLQSDWYRITWEEKGKAAKEFDNTNEMLPSTDDHAHYVKIKDRMYLFSVTEEIEERMLGDIQFFRCNNLTLLQNFDRMYQVGRGYGDIVSETVNRHINVPFASYGSPVELTEDFLSAKNPYTV